MSPAATTARVRDLFSLSPCNDKLESKFKRMPSIGLVLHMFVMQMAGMQFGLFGMYGRYPIGSRVGHAPNRRWARWHYARFASMLHLPVLSVFVFCRFLLEWLCVRMDSTLASDCRFGAIDVLLMIVLFPVWCCSRFGVMLMWPMCSVCSWLSGLYGVWPVWRACRAMPFAGMLHNADLPKCRYAFCQDWMLAGNAGMAFQ
ncbi:hypothetical protein Nepgr_033694 [Nepenthes gracilis]|uniref:Uncharacterized protein n=1 Tax=Nepenthes gracilis TaxID=150966 RepID=A0AAD3TKW4_NEPGR|nr:hypothetical protein Nepgr_033694 [Nepenthes gracilis]